MNKDLKKVQKSILLLLSLSILFLFLGCTPSDRSPDENEQKISISVSVRDIYFQPISLMVICDQKNVGKTDQEGTILFETNNINCQIKLDSKNYLLLREEKNNNKLDYLFCVSDKTAALESTNFYSFSGKACSGVLDEEPVSGVNFLVGDKTIYTTDETGNFDIDFVYKNTVIEFEKQNCFFVVYDGAEFSELESLEIAIHITAFRLRVRENN